MIMMCVLLSVACVRADTQVVASFPVRSPASDAASSPGLLDSFFYDDLEATDSNAIPVAPEQLEER